MSGNIREKSGNFELDDKWQPCKYLSWVYGVDRKIYHEGD